MKLVEFFFVCVHYKHSWFMLRLLNYMYSMQVYPHEMEKKKNVCMYKNIMEYAFGILNKSSIIF